MEYIKYAGLVSLLLLVIATIFLSLKFKVEYRRKGFLTECSHDRGDPTKFEITYTQGEYVIGFLGEVIDGRRVLDITPNSNHMRMFPHIEEFYNKNKDLIQQRISQDLQTKWRKLNIHVRTTNEESTPPTA